MKFRILTGDNRETLKTISDNSVDAIVTDPPYGIDFLGKEWDATTGSLETYKECLRVLKPGGHILAFSAARTYHHLAITIEQAGFEIRDQLMWIYSSGFPKSKDIGRQLHKKEHGKPDKQRFDPAIMIKQNDGNYKHPDKDILYRMLPDINGDRLANSHEGDKYSVIFEEVINVEHELNGWGTNLKPAHEPIVMARKPMKTTVSKNAVKYGTGAIKFDACRIPYEGDKPSAGNRTASFHNATGEFDATVSGGDGSGGWTADDIGRFPSNVLGEIEGYQKYFYCPKVNKQERGEMNNHPTVKPVELMKYLIKLVTPKDGIVLDPFTGSGSTGMAAVELGFEFIGCELDPNYVNIANTRIQAWYDSKNANTFNKLFEEE